MNEEIMKMIKLKIGCLYDIPIAGSIVFTGE